jgi:small subunit ribosomal protein S16
VAVKIRLKRMGKIRAPFYRVVVMDSRTKRDGRAIEEIGKYHPTEEPSLIDISSERALHWLGRGAQPTEAVEALLKVTGDWQKFKGVDGTEGTLRVKAPRTSKKELYEAAVAASGASLDTKDGATTPRKRAAKAAPRTEANVAPTTEAQAEDPQTVAALEDAAEQEVVREAEAERSVTSEKGEDKPQDASDVKAGS